MKLKNVETTYICQLSKPQNIQMLNRYIIRRDKSGKELASYYRDLTDALKPTPCWGVSGVNKMINELTDKVRNTLRQAKSGKTSAYAHANSLVNKIKQFGNEDAVARYVGNYKLQPLLTEEELTELESLE